MQTRLLKRLPGAPLQGWALGGLATLVPRLAQALREMKADGSHARILATVAADEAPAACSPAN